MANQRGMRYDPSMFVEESNIVIIKRGRAEAYAQRMVLWRRHDPARWEKELRNRRWFAVRECVGICKRRFVSKWPSTVAECRSARRGVQRRWKDRRMKRMGRGLYLMHQRGLGYARKLRKEPVAYDAFVRRSWARCMRAIVANYCSA